MGVLTKYELVRKFVKHTNLSDDVKHLATSYKGSKTRFKDYEKYLPIRVKNDYYKSLNNVTKWVNETKEKFEKDVGYHSMSPPETLCGNENTWKLLNSTVDLLFRDGYRPKNYKTTRKRLMTAIIFSNARKIEGSKGWTERRAYAEEDSSMHGYSSLRSFAEDLMELRKTATRKFERIAKFKRCEENGYALKTKEEKEYELFRKTSRGRGAKVKQKDPEVWGSEAIYESYPPKIREIARRQKWSEIEENGEPYCGYPVFSRIKKVWLAHIGGLFHLRVGDSSGFITSDHLDKMIDFLKAASAVVLSLHGSSSAHSPVLSFKIIFRAMEHVFVTRPEHVGEYFKAARTMMIAEMLDTGLMGDPAINLIQRDYDAPKKRYANLIRDSFKTVFRGQVDRVNYSHMYKIVLHPDISLEESFDKVEGIRSTNYIDPDLLLRFEGTLRRDLYQSLRAQGLTPSAQEGEGYEPLVDELRSHTLSKDSIEGYTSDHWSKIRFTRVPGLPDISEIDVKPADKSSAPKSSLTRRELNDLARATKALYLTDNVNEKCKKLRPINDIISELTGVSGLRAASAIEKFKHVKRMHEAFEEKYRNIGLTPEQIPSQDLADFVLTHPDLPYAVLTEPKLGEKHKATPRLFYMAEQSLKALTQRLERFARKVSKKQIGVSITKTFRSREEDLEEFASSVYNAEFGFRNIFLSFDMSEFSKKFPMQLVRIYGRIMAELSGEDWMSRIDLIFRNCIMMHSTRGFFDYKAGLKGGMEGFLNFIWSSIHAAVMSVALQEEGIAGLLLAYSDDGILRFTVPEDTPNEEVKRLVLSIQQTYRSHGLVFHLGKTIVSEIGWEYLGDVCYDRSILPMYVKELCSFGYYVKDRTFEPFASKIVSVNGQCSAIASAKGPVQLAEILNLAEVFTILSNRFPGASELKLAFLTVIPNSCGGFRVPSSFELSEDNSVPVISEFISDLYGLRKIFPVECACILESVIERLRTSEKQVESVITGTYLSTNINDTSGISAANYLIDCLVAMHGGTLKIKESPLTSSKMVAVKGVLSTMGNIDIGAMSKYFAELEDWKAYQKSKSLVKSKAALKLLGRDRIKRAQFKDSKSVQRAINFWMKSLSEFRGVSSEPTKLLSKIMNVTFKGLSVAMPKLSPRLLLKKTNRPTIYSNRVRFKIGRNAD